MRIVDRPEKKKPENGKTYIGTITEYRFVDMVSKKTGKPLKGIKLKIQPDDREMANIEAFDWIGNDENGMFIYRGSKLDHWLQRIFNVTEVSSIRFDDVKNKKCLYVVSASTKPDPKTNQQRTYYNVEDILSLPVGAFVAAPPPQTTPVAAQPVPAAQPAPAAAPVQGADPAAAPAGQNGAAQTASGDWSNGEIL